ncbi:replication initiation protein, partial [Acinetobacter baumannii]|uniref:replication initiation protein n=1 Tax=Acinetobacter baumannii TaxID=470 RepID=UPI003AF5DAE2
YIQLNSPFYQKYLILDLDYEHSLAEILFSRVGIPLPNFVTASFQGGKSHIVFELEEPIYKTNASKQKIIAFAHAIIMRLQELFDADIGYSGTITKNPISPNWRVTELRKKPYSLYELAEKIDLPRKDYSKQKISVDEAIGLGRNCYVFYTACPFAYQEIRAYRGKTYSQWEMAMIDHCMSLNENLSEPMTYREVRCIAKSISRFCWKNDAYCYQEFIDRQKRKGSLGGKKSKRGAKANSERSTKPWEAMGISRATYYRRQNKPQK